MGSNELGQIVDKYQAAAAAMIALGLIITAVSVAGEFLGWWHDLGELGTVLGVALTALGIVVAILLGATKRDVLSVVGEVRTVREEVRVVGDEVRKTGRTLDRHTDILVEIRDRLPSPRESS